MLRTALALTLLAAGCSAESPADDDSAALVPDNEGKADTLALAGTFEIAANELDTDDIANVRFAGTQYVRSKCYGAGCAELVPQWGEFRLFKNASGSKYVQFYTMHL